MPDISDSAVRELAQKILARPEYADARPSSTDTWLLSMLHRLFDWLGGLGGLRLSDPALYWLMIVGLFTILAAMVAHIVWTISTALRAPEPPSRSPSGATLRDHAAEAELLAASGSYLEAAHHLMIGSFRTLAERSVIDLRPDRSNRWIRRALHESKLNENLIREIDRLVARTERHWFGDRENSPAIYSDWKSAFDQVSRAI